MSKAIGVLAVVAMAASGCVGGTKSVKADNERLQEKVAELRAQSRGHRNKIRDLESEVTVLKVDSNSSAYDGPVGDDVPLRVEVVEPEYFGDPDLPPENEPLEFGGYDEDGAEVVYVGEAAVGPSVKISGDRYDLASARRGSIEPERPARKPAAKTLAPIPIASDRLAVTGRSLPKVSRVADAPAPVVVEPEAKSAADPQLRQARSLRPRSRKHSFEDPTVEYERYYTALRAGRHAEAVAGFRNFVSRFPDHGHADNAQYWLGEAFYDQRQFRSATVEFEKVLSMFPEGNKVPDAMLKLGYCYAHLGETSKAKKALRRVIRDFPSSNPAALAARKLEQL